MEKIRLDKYLSSQMNISRTDAKKLLKKKAVSVNGEVALKGDADISVCSDKVTVYGKEIEYKKYIYIMMNKPKGVVSVSSSETDKTVIDILPEKFLRRGLFPAGRLDKDTTGFVLITDDGEFAHDILSPAHHVAKTYITDLLRKVTPDEFRRFDKGIETGTEKFRPSILSFSGVNPDTENPVYEITITEGRYHQIKRMFAATGNKVIELRRIKIGNLELDSALAPGEAREITSDELAKIKN